MLRHFAAMRSLALLAAVVAPVYATCYYPDGSDAAKDYTYEPCGNSAFATCCYFGEGDTCLDNGLCSQPNKPDYRAACANADWSNCPEVCMSEDRSTWYPLTKCGENQYCCPSTKNNCCTSGAQIYTLTTSNSTSSSGSTSSDSTSSDSTSGSSSGTSSNSEKTVVVTSSAGGGSVPAGPIAGGVVGGVFVIGLLALGFFYLKKRGKKNVVASSPEAGVEGGGATATGAPTTSGSSSMDGKGISHMKVLNQPNVAEVEGQLGKVWNEADSKPMIMVSPTLADEKLGFFAQGTAPSPMQPQGGFANGGATLEADSRPVITHTVQPPRTPTVVEQTPIAQYTAEMDGGGMTSSSGSSVNSSLNGEPVTHLGVAPGQPAHSSDFAAEMENRTPTRATFTAHQLGSTTAVAPSGQQLGTPQYTSEVEGTVVMQTALGPMVSTTIEQSYSPASSLAPHRTRSNRRAAEMDGGGDFSRRTPSPANSTSTLGKNRMQGGSIFGPQHGMGGQPAVMEADSSPVPMRGVQNQVQMSPALATRNAAEADGNAINEADSSPTLPSSARLGPVRQPTNNGYNGTTEIDGNAVMEADSRPAALPVLQSRIQTTITSPQNAAEMDSRELLEADSNPVAEAPANENAVRTTAASAEQQQPAHELS